MNSGRLRLGGSVCRVKDGESRELEIETNPHKIHAESVEPQERSSAMENPQNRVECRFQKSKLPAEYAGSVFEIFLPGVEANPARCGVPLQVGWTSRLSVSENAFARKCPIPLPDDAGGLSGCWGFEVFSASFWLFAGLFDPLFASLALSLSSFDAFGFEVDRAVMIPLLRSILEPRTTCRLAVFVLAG